MAASDVELAHREGFRAVELLKRYTTLGMATDQGKTSNLAGLSIMAELTGKDIPSVGTTVFRPPFTPVAIGAFAGHHRGKDFRATRHVPSHAWAEENGGVFVETGLWLRPAYFPKAGETDWLETVVREVETVRARVGICDVTTLARSTSRAPTPSPSSSGLRQSVRDAPHRQGTLCRAPARGRVRARRRHGRAAG